MRRTADKPDRGPLFDELQWFIRLRWLAAGAVIAGGVLEWRLGWFGHGPVILGVGVVILSYNTVLWAILGRRERPRPGQEGSGFKTEGSGFGVQGSTAQSLNPEPRTLNPSDEPRARRGRSGEVRAARRRSLRALSWVQIVLDLGCLTVLALLTGGLHSPLVHFFYLHMVFASILLPRFMAFGAASVAMVLLSGGLWVTGQWPEQYDRESKLVFVGWLFMLLLVVQLASHLSRAVRRHRRRLLRQNRRIRGMSRHLKRHQRAMIQHEKMVALGQMAAGVAHEIANPLASIDSLLQLMQRKPERLRPEAVTTLREQVGRINQIIQQMTSFAHPADAPGGGGGAQWQTVALNDVVAQALRMARMDKRLRAAKVVEDYAADAGELRLLPQALEQVLVNLMINAGDAMAEKEVASGALRVASDGAARNSELGTRDSYVPELTVRTHRSGEWAVVEVTDNGSGIRPEHLHRIFEPFFTTKPVGRGTGLGLSISYSLVRKQGGHLDVQSEAGKGSTFRVRLPGGPPAREPRRPPAAAAQEAGSA